MRRRFDCFAAASSAAVGSPWAFSLAVLLTVMWAASGPLFQFSDTWQLVCNTVSTISTGLIVFLLQNSANRDAKALHAKLDAMIAATQGAPNDLIGSERPDKEA